MSAYREPGRQESLLERARRLTGEAQLTEERRRKASFPARMKKVAEAIEEAASRGRFCLSFGDIPGDDVIKELTRQGFEVVTGLVASVDWSMK
jgi:hypothetical protein